VWVVLKVVQQRWAEVHWLMWIVFVAFVLYFAQAWINGLITPAG
jgi:xanthine/uracil/vitamin C permease (AzgA family)